MEKNIFIDFHAHILPGMDHGCADVAMSIAQLSMAAEQGIDIIVATSHFYPHAESAGSFLRRRQEAWESLKARYTKERPQVSLTPNMRQPKSSYAKGRPAVRLGAEVLICNNIDKMEGIKDLCIEGSNVLLAEMPSLREWDAKLIGTVERLREEKKLEVVLAHAERYPAGEIKKLLEKGFQVQLNVASLTGLFPSSLAEKYINDQCVTAFGSDIHGLDNSYKKFARVMKGWGPQAEGIMEKTREFFKEDRRQGKTPEKGI